MKKKLLFLLFVFCFVLISCEKENLEDTRSYFHNGRVYTNETYKLKDSYRSFDVYCPDCDQSLEIEVLIEHKGSLTGYGVITSKDTLHVEWIHQATMCRFNASNSIQEMIVMNLK